MEGITPPLHLYRVCGCFGWCTHLPSSMPKHTVGVSLAFQSSGFPSLFSTGSSRGTNAMQRIRDSTLKHSVTLGFEFCNATMETWPMWLVQLATWKEREVDFRIYTPAKTIHCPAELLNKTDMSTKVWGFFWGKINIFFLRLMDT